MSAKLTLLSLLTILIAGTLALGAAHLAEAETALVARLERRTEALMRLSACADEATALLSAQAAAAPDSLAAPVHTRIEALAEETGLQISLTDLSSRFNLNTLRKTMITATAVGEYLKPGRSPAALQQYRVDAGLSLNKLDHYGAYFEAPALNNYLTVWGYWHINTADEFTLERIFELRTGDEGAARIFHTRLREVLRKRRLITTDELRGFIGTAHYEMVFPVINADPPVNINTAGEWIITQLLSYESFRVVSPEETTDRVISLRKERPLKKDELFDLIPVVETEHANRLFAWLGDTTWFWELRIEDRAGTVLTRVLARIPDEGSAEGVREYRVVDEEIPW